MNPTKIQLEFCEKHNITFDQFTGKKIIMGSLHLSLVTKLPKGFSPIVSRGLYLNSIKVLPEGFNPTVGGGFHLGSVTHLPKGFNPTVGGGLVLYSVTELPEGFNPTVGNTLYLNSVKVIPKGFSPTVGSHLNLKSVKTIPKGFNPIVGECIHIKNRVLDESEYNKKDTNFIDFKNGYIKCDDIFMQVTSHKGNVWKGHRIGSSDDLYLVSDGNSRYAHGDTLKEAKEDLIFKVDGRRPDDFEHLNEESVLSFEESIIAYRVITGACSYGVKDYIRNRLPSKQKEFLMSEVIELTKDEYGGESFRTFVENK